MAEPQPMRILRGHAAAATCCIASTARPDLIATAAEDGCVCLLVCDAKMCSLLWMLAMETLSPQLCFKPGNEDIIYVSAENEVNCFELKMAAPWKQQGSYNYNKDEINQPFNYLASKEKGLA